MSAALVVGLVLTVAFVGYLAWVAGGLAVTLVKVLRERRRSA